MSRAGYCDDGSYWDLIKWRGQVESAIRGKRGQAFLHDLIEALDALPRKELIAYDLQKADGSCCALGALGRARGIDMTEMCNYDGEINDELADLFNIAEQLAREVQYLNDEGGRGWWPAPKRDANGRMMYTERDGHGFRHQINMTNEHGEEVNESGVTKAQFDENANRRRYNRIALWAWENLYWTEIDDQHPKPGLKISAVVEEHGRERVVHGSAQPGGYIVRNALAQKIIAWKVRAA